MRPAPADAAAARSAAHRPSSVSGVGSAVACCGKGCRRAGAQSPVTLTMAAWGGQAERDAFTSLVGKYRALHPNVTVRLEFNGNATQLYQVVDTRLAGHQAPDIFRIQYQGVGRYASAGALVDITPHLAQGDGSQFAPAFWPAVTFKGKQFALPHHTDTFALYYNVEFLRELGVDMPRSLDAVLVQRETGAAQYVDQEQRADTDSVRQRHHRHAAARRLDDPSPATEHDRVHWSRASPPRD